MKNITKTILLISLIVTFNIVFSQEASATDALTVEQECTNDGLQVMVLDEDGNPVNEARVITTDTVRAAEVMRVFKTNESGGIIFTSFPDETWLKITKGGFYDKVVQTTQCKIAPFSEDSSQSSQANNIPRDPTRLRELGDNYVNYEAGMELDIPEGWNGAEIKFYKEFFENAPTLNEYDEELRQNVMDLFSGFTMVVLTPPNAFQENQENFEMITIFIMDGLSLNVASEFMSEGFLDVGIDSADLGMLPGRGISSESLKDSPCEIQTPSSILFVNDMKAIQITANCRDFDIATSMSSYNFATNTKIISISHIEAHYIENVAAPTKLADVLNTLRIENTIDISNPSHFAELVQANLQKEEILVGNDNYEIELVSLSDITDFSFDEENSMISFRPLIKNDHYLDFTQIHLGELFDDNFTVKINEKQFNGFVVYKDATTGEKLIDIPYVHPVEKIEISGILKDIESQDKKTQPKSQIPDWIRNNAKWWSEGNIDDESFVGGIQFLVKEGIMQIPETTTQSSEQNGSQEMPGWIKSNAEWWSQGLISDDDFIKGIQHLIEQGIIRV